MEKVIAFKITSMPYYQDQMIAFSEIYINCPIYSYRTFGLYMYSFAATHYSTTVKVPHSSKNIEPKTAF